MLIKNETRSAVDVRQLSLPAVIPAEVKNEQKAKRKARLSAMTKEIESSIARISALEKMLQEQHKERYEQGYKAGRDKGIAEGLAQISERVQALATIIEAIGKQQVAFIQGSRDFVMDFTFNVLEKILGEKSIQNVKLEIDKFGRLLSEAINQFTEPTELSFRVHQELVPMIEENRSSIEALLPANYKYKIIADPILKRSECIIECDYGALDGRLQAQFDTLKAHVMANED